MPAPQLAMPFRVENGRVATVQQDSVEDVRACVIACLRTRRGSRLEAPGYGIPNELFKRQSRAPDIGIYLRAVEEVEPRAALLAAADFEDLVQSIVISQGAVA